MLLSVVLHTDVHATANLAEAEIAAGVVVAIIIGFGTYISRKFSGMFRDVKDVKSVLITQEPTDLVPNPPLGIIDQLTLVKKEQEQFHIAVKMNQEKMQAQQDEFREELSNNTAAVQLQSLRQNQANGTSKRIETMVSGLVTAVPGATLPEVIDAIANGKKSDDEESHT